MMNPKIKRNLKIYKLYYQACIRSGLYPTFDTYHQNLLNDSEVLLKLATLNQNKNFTPIKNFIRKYIDK